MTAWGALARYCARCPVSLERLEYDAQAGTVTYTSYKAAGPTAGRHTFEAADFIVLLVAHIPDKGQVLQRYYGYYANRTRGERRKAAEATAEEAGADEHGSEQRDAELPLDEVKVVEPEDFLYGDAKRRWAELIRLIYEVDPLACPRCSGPMRVIALIQEPKVIDRIRQAPARAWPRRASRPVGDGAAARYGRSPGGVRRRRTARANGIEARGTGDRRRSRDRRRWRVCGGGGAGGRMSATAAIEAPKGDSSARDGGL